MHLLWILQEPGTRERSLLHAIPTDPASIFVYVLVVVAAYAVWRGSRPTPKGPRGPGDG